MKYSTDKIEFSIELTKAQAEILKLELQKTGAYELGDVFGVMKKQFNYFIKTYGVYKIVVEYKPSDGFSQKEFLSHIEQAIINKLGPFCEPLETGAETVGC